MKGPTRPAPTVPGMGVTRYSPVTNWDSDPFGADLFEPTPNVQKKKPPPRPPPPKISLKQPEIPAKPSHFIRKPTVLSSLLSRKTKSTNNSSSNVNIQQTFITDFSEVDATKMFPKCEPKNVQTGALIDLSSPPSSPTFTTRSSSDGLSVDSFGSDATTSTNQHNHHGGNASQAESGFEDDFDLFLNTRKMGKDETLDNFTSDPFSPQPMIKPPIMKKPVITKESYESWSQSKPTIIRAKPARPKPPDNSALLKNTFGGNFQTAMTVNTTTPIHKITGGFGDSFDSKPFCWDDDRSPESPDREPSPPMPSIPPPPPPDVIDEDLQEAWSCDADAVDFSQLDEDSEPHGIALFDYFTDHADDLYFSANTRIKIIRRVDNEWLYGGLKNGTEGTFPSNYIEVKVPLPNEKLPSPPILATAVALYDFAPDHPGDLRFLTGDTIIVQYKLNDEWYYGKCNGSKGQFPINYVQMS